MEKEQHSDDVKTYLLRCERIQKTQRRGRRKPTRSRPRKSFIRAFLAVVPEEERGEM